MYYSDLDIKDIEEIPEPGDRSGGLSDFFLETFPDCFPEVYTGELFDFFRLVAHPLRRCFDTPQASPRNEEIASATRNRGQPGSHTFVRENGHKFVLRPLMDWMFSRQNEHRKHYYTSDTRLALLYLDVDCHLAYQTPATGKQAARIIETELANRLGVSLSFLGSNRGEMGYLKVDIGTATPEAANRVFDQFQEAVRLLLATNGSLADFEVKGTVTWIGADGKLHAGQYGKLPMCSPDWNYAWFEALRRSRKVTLSELERFIAGVRAAATEEALQKHEDARHRAFLAHYLPVGQQIWHLYGELGHSWVDDNLVTYRGQQWIARNLLEAELVQKLWKDQPPVVESAGQSESAPAANIHQVVIGPDGGELSENVWCPPCTAQRGSARAQARPTDEPDSLVRQREALLALARSLRRVPTLEEALEHIRRNGFYTGTWAENFKRRRSRVRGILTFIARTFDASRCRGKCGKTASVPHWFQQNADKYAPWALKKFPDGLAGGKRKVVGLDGDVVKVGQVVHVGPQFIAAFVAVCEFCLLVDPNTDGTLPHHRAKELWNALQGIGLFSVPFCPRKWAVCREELVRWGIVTITDRQFHAGKAMGWAVGTFFPCLGLWKTRKQPSLLPPVKLTSFLFRHGTPREEQHNSLLRKQPFQSHSPAPPCLPRPPPHSHRQSGISVSAIRRAVIAALPVPGRRGVEGDSQESCAPQVLFSYRLIIAFQVLVGEVRRDGPGRSSCRRRSRLSPSAGQPRSQPESNHSRG